MADEESNEVYGKLKDYPQLIKGVEDDSKVLMETQDKVITEQFGSMRNKITESLNNLTHPNVWPENEDSRVLEVMIQGLQQIVMGIHPPEKVAQDIQEVKQRVLRQ